MKINKRQDEFNYIGEVSGDKSITHRAIMLLSLTENGGTIYNPLRSFDTHATMDCITRLGGKFEDLGDKIVVTPPEEFLQNKELDCQNSGTTIRLMMGLLAGLSVNATLDGDESLKKRPMKRVTDYLDSMGASTNTNNGYTPVVINSSELNPSVDIDLTVPSAQVKSAIILAGLLGGGKTTIKYHVKTRDHSERMIKYLGGDITDIDNVITINKSKLVGRDINVCGDISSASFVIAGALLGGSALIKNVGVNPSRNGILKVLDLFGANYKLLNQKEVCGEPVCDIEVKKTKLKPINLSGDIIANIIDEIPIIATLMAFCNGKSSVRDAKELRIKESDRIALIVNNLKKAGVEVVEYEDGFDVLGTGSVSGGDFEVITGGDHRIAMAFTVLGQFSDNGLSVDDMECIGVSFSRFAEIFNV